MTWLVGILLMAAAEEPPADCYRAKTMKDVRLCMDDARHAEMEMQDTYYDQLQKLDMAGREDDYKKLVVAQRAWQNERHESCNKISEHWGNGSIRDAYYVACMKERAEQRTAEIQGKPAPPSHAPPTESAPQPDGAEQEKK